MIQSSTGPETPMPIERRLVLELLFIVTALAMALACVAMTIWGKDFSFSDWGITIYDRKESGQRPMVPYLVIAATVGWYAIVRTAWWLYSRRRRWTDTAWLLPLVFTCLLMVGWYNAIHLAPQPKAPNNRHHFEPYLNLKTGWPFAFHTACWPCECPPAFVTWNWTSLAADFTLWLAGLSAITYPMLVLMRRRGQKLMIHPPQDSSV